MLKQAIMEAYLDYYNNYLSIAAFAEAYNMSGLQALTVIDLGREFNHEL